MNDLEKMGLLMLILNLFIYIDLRLTISILRKELKGSE